MTCERFAIGAIEADGGGHGDDLIERDLHGHEQFCLWVLHEFDLST